LACFVHLSRFGEHFLVCGRLDYHVCVVFICVCECHRGNALGLTELWKCFGLDRAVKMLAATREFQTISLLMLRNMLAIPAETENQRIDK